MFDFKDVLAPISDIIDKVLPDKNAAAAAKAQLALQAQAGNLQQQLDSLVSVTTAQSDINKVEAASSSVFVAGWRPFVGWVCASGLAYVTLIEPFSRFIAQVCFKYSGTFPVIDTTITLQALFGMLGMGAMHVYENTQKK